MDIQELKKQLNYLEETKQLIKEQLVAKGQPVDENTTFREYVDNMNDLVDTTDANATSNDMVLNKTAYVGGQKITGILETAAGVSIDNSNNTDTHIFLTNVSDIPSMVVNAEINDLYGVRKIVEDGVDLEIIAPQSQIADVISLTTDKIKAGESILGVQGSASVVDTEDANAVAENIINGQTAYVNGEKVTGTMQTQTTWFVNNAKHLSSSHLGESYGLNKLSYNSPVAMPKTNSGQIYVTIPRETLASSLGITADVVKTGTFISGVTGTFTSDANAVANDIVSGKTAYVNGQKLTGDLTTYASGEKFEQTISMTAAYDSATNMLLLGSNPGQCAFKGGTIELSCSGNTIATSANITANKIAVGETVLGIVGTYMGTAMKEYASVTDMNNDIANISEGELVKVVESGTTSYFIKETIDNVPTMTKLVKESETMSPQEYEDANDIADEILGE